MTREQAAKEAKKRWGAKALWRAYEKQSSPERRAAATEANRTARERKTAIDAEIAERLKALDWYQALVTERRELVRQLQYCGEAVYHKFSVGKNAGIGFEVMGQGDTWEQAFKAADDYQARERERYAVKVRAS